MVAGFGLVSSCASRVEEIFGPVVEQQIAGNTRMVTVSGRKAATQKFLAITPSQIEASVVLFAGDSGHLGLSDSGSIQELSGNFLIKSRHNFVQQGMLVAVVDTPSDRSSLDNFRSSRAHAVDIGAVISWLRQAADVPVWLVGTSRGTISAAAVAGELASGGPDGIVLTSTLFGPSKRGTVYKAKIKAIKVPVLVVHHRNDACVSTPYSNAAAFMHQVSGAPRSELITIEGGVGNLGNPCGARSPHGFLGLENKVVKQITDWIKAN
jgi:hypothetical protein